MDNDEALQEANKALDDAIEQKKRNQEFMRSVGPAVVEALRPSLNEIRDTLKSLKIELPVFNLPKIDVPHTTVDVNFPDFEIPTPQVNYTPPVIKMPAVKVPKPEVTVNFDASKIKFPKVEMPEFNFPKRMEVGLDKYNDYFGLPVKVLNQITLPSVPRIMDKPRNNKGGYDGTSVSTTATLIRNDNGGRKSVAFTHEASADTVYFGLDANVTTINGLPIVANQIFGVDDYTGPLYAIISTGAASSTISVRYFEF